MRVLCAPDSFKESLSAVDAAKAMADGVRDAGGEADICPIADGGEGTLDALIGAMGGTIHEATVTGPLGGPVEARFGVAADGATGIVELAEASGLALMPREKRDPMRTTTFGTGQLIRLAFERGCCTVIVCIGGSGTVDGGAGMAQALGVRFLDDRGEEISTPLTGGLLSRIASIEAKGVRLGREPMARAVPAEDHPDSTEAPAQSAQDESTGAALTPRAVGSRLRAERCESRSEAAFQRIRIACDVTNPLCGERGAAAVYGPQKGATPEQVKLLDANLAHLARLAGAAPDTPGFGAAGGAAVGLVALCGGQLERGIDLVLDAVGFDSRCREVDLVLTGEGRLDEQSLSGKATMGVARATAKLGVPTIAIVGSTGPGAERCVDPDHGGALARYVSLSELYGADRAMREAASLVRETASEVVRRFLTERSQRPR